MPADHNFEQSLRVTIVRAELQDPPRCGPPFAGEKGRLALNLRVRGRSQRLHLLRQERLHGRVRCRFLRERRLLGLLLSPPPQQPPVGDRLSNMRSTQEEKPRVEYPTIKRHLIYVHAL